MDADPGSLFSGSRESSVLDLQPVPAAVRAASRINIPCRGCFGPVPGVVGSGPKFLSTLTSLLQVEKDEDIRRGHRLDR